MGSKAIDMGGSDTRPAGRKAEVANAHAFIRIGYVPPTLAFRHMSYPSLSSHTTSFKSLFLSLPFLLAISLARLKFDPRTTS